MNWREIEAEHRRIAKLFAEHGIDDSKFSLPCLVVADALQAAMKEGFESHGPELEQLRARLTEAERLLNVVIDVEPLTTRPTLRDIIEFLRGIK